MMKIYGFDGKAGTVTFLGEVQKGRDVLAIHPLESFEEIVPESVLRQMVVNTDFQTLRSRNGKLFTVTYGRGENEFQLTPLPPGLRDDFTDIEDFVFDPGQRAVDVWCALLTRSDIPWVSVESYEGRPTLIAIKPQSGYTRDVETGLLKGRSGESLAMDIVRGSVDSTVLLEFTHSGELKFFTIQYQ